MTKRGTSSKQKPAGAGAVMASRRSPLAALDFFPTPPWATRALMAHVLGPEIASSSVWEPAAGGGHMAEVLREGFGALHASDVHDYGRGYAVGSFVGASRLPSRAEGAQSGSAGLGPSGPGGEPAGTRGDVGFGLDIAHCPFVPDWVVTNPPFNLALEFVQRARQEARRGVAMLVRTAWLESEGRYSGLFQKSPPAEVALFVERVPMVEGRWDPEASTATSYCWVIWDRTRAGPTVLSWIPPGRRSVLTKPDDVGRFAMVNTEDAPSRRLPAGESEGASKEDAAA